MPDRHTPPRQEQRDSGRFQKKMDARLLAMMELKTQQNKIKTPTEDIIKESS